MKNLFTIYSLYDFNSIYNTDIDANDTLDEAMNKIENEGITYFYVSMDDKDVLDAIEDEKEIADQLDIDLVFIDEVGIYIALT